MTCPLTHCHIPEDLTLQQRTGLVVYLVATAHNGNMCRNAEVLRQQYWCLLLKLFCVKSFLPLINSIWFYCSWFLHVTKFTWILLWQWMIAGLRTYRGKLWYLPVEGCKVQSPQTYTSGLTRSVSHCAESGNQPVDIFPASSYTPVHPSRSYHDSIDLQYHTPQVSSSGVPLLICVKSIEYLLEGW